MRVFAGPNGSGKSTIIQAVREYRIKEIPIDFGTYVNADDINSALQKDEFSFTKYKVTTARNDLIAHAVKSGLVGKGFSKKNFAASFTLGSQNLVMKQLKHSERVAQILADFLRVQLLSLKRKFSFETVFSHPSKLQLMRDAAKKGYKIYLYFVSTESPDINIYRVGLRKEKGGHDVPKDKIRSPYKRSLELMHDAAQLAYQSYFFDNSGVEPKLFAHFKVSKGKKRWDPIDPSSVPEWFIKYYLDRIK
jgi:predicted ABC-type ATPase